jgi:electron transfer flavoprotein beta subunit
VIVMVCLEPPSPGLASRAALALTATLASHAKVVVIAAGGASDCQSMRLARSCTWVSRVVHLHDSTLDHADFMTMGTALSEAARHLEANLIITGEHADDEGQGMVPAVIAGHLRAPLLSRAQAVRLPASADTVEVEVRSGGQICTLACPLPLVLTTPPLLGEAAEAPGPAVREVELLALAVLGIDACRLVPRPSLLGTLVPPPPAHESRRMTPDAVTTALLRHC